MPKRPCPAALTQLPAQGGVALWVAPERATAALARKGIRGKLFWACALSAKRFAHPVRRRLARVTIAVNARRVVILIYTLLFFALSAVFGVSLWQTRAEYLQLRAQEAVSQRRLAEAEQRLQEQQQILARLRTDPAYVERNIRQQLGYAKPDEFIFRFEP
jgi:cell division protein DivIC